LSFWIASASFQRLRGLAQSLSSERAANAVDRVIGDAGEDVTEIASGSTPLSLTAQAPETVLGISFDA
jgi:hypothetical protein